MMTTELRESAMAPAVVGFGRPAWDWRDWWVGMRSSGTFRRSVFRRSNSVFSPLRRSVPFGVWSFGNRSFDVGSLFGLGSNLAFGHSAFGHSASRLSAFGHSAFGHSASRLSAFSRTQRFIFITGRRKAYCEMKSIH